MTSSSSHKVRSIGLSQCLRVLAFIGALPLVACGAYKNREERDQAARKDREEAARLGAGPKNPAACIRTCAPDPGSNPVNCEKAEEGIEFMDPPVWDFEPEPPPGEMGPYMFYTYDDGSAPRPYRWRERVERCGTSTTALHLAAGPALGWGGGVGTSIKDWWGRNGGTRPCTGPGAPMPCESPEVDASQVGRTVDASQWDGISLWARRGPESQAGIRVTVGDKYTDDDLNVDADAADPAGNGDGVDAEQRYCKRARECECPSNRPCNVVPGEIDLNSDGRELKVCWDPRYDSPPVAEEALNLNTIYLGEKGERYYPCDYTACNQPYSAGGADPAFQFKACTPYASLNGQKNSYCFNPGEDPTPAEGYEKCGDHWQTPVRLSTDWQLFLVPFSGMLQQGYGKESPRLLTDQISIVRFTYEGGWVDIYVDDVRFYRVKR